MPRTRTAFSTVACPDWTLDRVAESAGRWGFDGVELRTGGYGSRDWACDPALTAPEKVRFLLDDAGVAASSLATALRLDEPIRPKVLGYVLGDHESAVRQAKRMIDLASQVEAAFVRVWGFEVRPGATRDETIELVEQRLRAIVDHADKTGVVVVLENGGSFPTSTDLLIYLDRIRTPLLAASYSPAVAAAAGEDPAAGLAALSGRLALVKVKPPASGKAHAGRPDVRTTEALVRAAVAAGAAWVVVEWDRAFVPGLEEPDCVLPATAEMLGRLVGRAPRVSRATNPAQRG